MSKSVAIIGAGFSGLSLAWRLQKLGINAEIFEASGKPGGLIQTEKNPVIAEHAAHAFLNSASVEELFADLGIAMARAKPESKSKWIFRGKPRKWSLHFLESLPLVRLIFRRKILPETTIRDWIGHPKINDYMAAPALQGVYGAQTLELSASLILGGIFSKALKPQRGKTRGSVAPLNGMNDLMQKLALRFKVHYSKAVTPEELQKFDAVILATDMTAASELLREAAPNLSLELAKIPKVSLTSVTITLDQRALRPQGFGCLFPAPEKFNALGVLFNDDIFENRGPDISETWIFADGFRNQSNEKILALIEKDRLRLSPEKLVTKSQLIARWPDTLPLYGLLLEKLLASTYFETRASDLKIKALQVFEQGARVSESEKLLYLTGNYLGGIGLAKILDYNERLAIRISREVKEKT